MANLPMDRTKLQAAITNQQPGTVASAQANREYLVEAADTIDLLNQKVDGLVAGGLLTNVPPDTMSRQAIINGNFDVWQRGVSWTNPNAGTFTADRFFTTANLDGGINPTSVVHSRTQMASSELDKSFYCYSITVNGSGSGYGVNASYGLFQRIENGVRYLCGNGKKVTLSFWARSSIAGKRIGVNIKQKYGSGGSTDDIIQGNVFTLSNTWTKYSCTFNTASIAGKTFGSNNDDNVQVGVHYLWGSTYSSEIIVGGTTPETFSGSGFINIAQVQLNAGEVAYPFQPKSFADELQACQRYYERLDSADGRLNLPAFVNTATEIRANWIFKVKKRAAPALTQGGTFRLLPGGGSTTLSSLEPTVNQFVIAGAVSGYVAGNAYTLQNQDTGGWIAADAEL